MRRIAVHISGQNNVGKGVVIGEDISTLEDLKLKLGRIFSLPVSKILWRSASDTSMVEVTDLDFIRDGDTMFIPGQDSDETTADSDDGDRWLSLNVGGRLFLTSRSTVEMKVPDSMLARMLASETAGMRPGSRDARGSIIIDRSPRYFEPILNYLRTGRLVLDEGLNPEGVYEEAKYYGVTPLLPALSALVSRHQNAPDECALSRRDVVGLIASTPCTRELRLQGVCLANADLSRLDLRFINFKYANMRGCNLSGANLSFCSMERCDLSSATLDGAQMLGVKMLCANLEASSLRGCNFDDPAGSTAIMEGVNLRAAVMEGSNMARVNLRVATIKHGNLRNCDLRAAVLAGADLEYCDLSGSDLGEANLRGANLKDTTLELMQTPLHMSQTIR